jgi:DNA-binding transcriptional regulator YiaG
MMEIKELRKQTGLSQSEFAKKFHLSIRTLQRWEQGQTDTPEYVLYMIHMILEYEHKSEADKENERRIKCSM